MALYLVLLGVQRLSSSGELRLTKSHVVKILEEKTIADEKENGYDIQTVVKPIITLEEGLLEKCLGNGTLEDPIVIDI